MNDKQEGTAIKVSLLIAYASMFGIGIWKRLRRRSISAPAHGDDVPEASLSFLTQRAAALAAPVEQREHLEDLSLDTPGDAPLDRLARRASVEERQTFLTRPGGGVDDPKSPLPQGPPQPWTHSSQSVADLLERQSLESARLTGWALPMPDRLPVPTYAPAVMALGIVVSAMGLATTWYVCLVGAAVFAVAAWRWVGELQGE